VDVPCPTGRNDEGRLPIRCRGGVFQGDAVEIGQPCLWVFDCRRGTTGGEDVCWTEVEYGNVMQHVKKWMEGIHRWNAVFLLPAGIFFDDSMRTRFGLAARYLDIRSCNGGRFRAGSKERRTSGAICASHWWCSDCDGASYWI
jgi:hypothetical protein